MAGWGSVTNPFGGSTQAAPADPVPATRTSASNAWGSVPLDDEPTEANDTQMPDVAWSKPKSSKKPVTEKMSAFTNSTFSSYNPNDLAAKAQELEAREEAVRRREAELLVGVQSTKNWPMFVPVLRHDIKADIPVWNRAMVWWAYRVWLLSAFAFVVNWAVILTMSFAGVAAWTAFFVATISTIIGLPMSFFMYYRRIYFAAQTDGAFFKYIMFLVCAFIHLAWCVWVLLSIPGPIGRPYAGLFNYLFVLMGRGGRYSVFAIMCAINIGLWGLAGLGVNFTIARGIMAMRAHEGPRLDYERRTGQSYVQA